MGKRRHPLLGRPADRLARSGDRPCGRRYLGLYIPLNSGKRQRLPLQTCHLDRRLLPDRRLLQSTRQRPPLQGCRRRKRQTDRRGRIQRFSGSQDLDSDRHTQDRRTLLRGNHRISYGKPRSAYSLYHRRLGAYGFIGSIHRSHSAPPPHCAHSPLPTRVWRSRRLSCTPSARL